MTDFFDWLTASDSGLAADRLASAYNLSPSELRDTAQALAPAFSLAMMRAMSDPTTASDLSRMFAPFFGSMDATSRRAAERSDVERLTDNLFGSKALVDAVSRQVSSVTGTAPDTVKPLMRNLTLMAMQTMMQMVGTTFMRGMENGRFDAADMPANMADLMRRSANAIEAFSRSPDAPASRRQRPADMSNVFADAFRGPLPWLPPMPFLSASNAMKPKEEERSKAETGGTDNLPPMPFLAIFEGFSKGLMNETEDKPHSEAPPRESETTGGETARSAEDALGFSRMMEAGTQMQSEYWKSMTALFDANPRREDPSPKE
ncbi:hypothetical protein DYI37_06065 [Fulvimarina endophytica]|uniref:DUF937 domain-containing protein n=1 Tax=Fulvimarina endophytica TaxID=2293836 RepID=A0A371X825_9HYPH|nr:hypothetical protein [Fulvimarina endophytica]RFC65385.1 hypothetical protein DYI37_06065 [Fulvimarina endophytica]